MVVATDVKVVSLMVHLPDCALSNGDLLEFYSDLHGAWQTLPSFWMDARSKDLYEVRKALDEKLTVFMKEVVENTDPYQNLNWSTFEEIGLRLYYDVIPDDVRKELRNAAGNPGPGQAPILRIHLPIKLTWIPWEIMYDDDIGFLGLCFQIARLPITSRIPDMSDTTPLSIRKIYNLLGRDVVDQDFSFDAWQRTFTDVIPGLQDIRYPHGQAADDEWPTSKHIIVEADILHITCHGMEDKFGTYWTLNLDHGTTKHEIRESTIKLNRKNLQKFRSLVFGNACTKIASEENVASTLTPGFGPAFYENGATAFVGTCASITKRVALEFPRKFYELLLQETLPVGEALLETKRYFYQQKDNKPIWNDPSWLFYCLYGSPETIFQISP